MFPTKDCTDLDLGLSQDYTLDFGIFFTGAAVLNGNMKIFRFVDTTICVVTVQGQCLHKGPECE